jgi:hypothetical protein
MTLLNILEKISYLNDGMITHFVLGIMCALAGITGLMLVCIMLIALTVNLVDYYNTHFRKPLPWIGIPEPENLVGWRCWRVNKRGYLESIWVSCIWHPGNIMTADKITDYARNGIHSYKEITKAVKHPIIPPYAIGQVRLWGIVIEHKDGHRAQHARIISIDVVNMDGSVCSEQSTKMLTYLREKYNLISEQERVED